MQVPVIFGLVAIFVVYLYLRATSGRVYLLDFACYRPPPSQQVTVKQCLWGLHTFGKVDVFLHPRTARMHLQFG